MMITNRKIAVTALVLLIGSVLALSALAQIAPDATGLGPLTFTSSEYKLAASADPDILAGTVTELWARVYRPVTLNDPPYPLIIFLHGNHDTCGHGVNPRIDDNCQYTSSGTCPGGYVVTPNHNGYGYIAGRLAAWGYIVVSINANRGVNCRNDGPPGDGALNLVRGRLILKHLQRLSEWNTFAGTTPLTIGLGASGLLGKIDFGSVGLMGHSRGGEGVRAAYNQYRDAGSPWPGRIPDRNTLTFQGIFEIGPVDRQVTSRILNADGTNWNVLLPMCDGDVASLPGVRPFDRMLRIFSEDYVTPKSTYTVWGTNHNFYNTEWQTSDSGGCTGHSPIFGGPPGSPQQQQVGRASLMAFIRGNVFGTPVSGGYNPDFIQNFNPQYGLPFVVTSVTRVDRGYSESPDTNLTIRFEDFQGATGFNSPSGVANNASNITISHGGVPNHDSVQRAGIISWTAGANRFFQTNWTAPGVGRDVRGYATLDLRVSRQSSGLNPPGPTNFSIQLVRFDGALSGSAQLSTYTDLRGPVGGPGGIHPILQTARIPLTAFGGADLSRVRGVRLTFNGTPSGAIYVGDIRVSILSGSPFGATSDLPPPDMFATDFIPSETPIKPADNKMVNTISSIRSVPSSPTLEDKPGVEIEVVSSERFPARNELVVLRIGKSDFTLSRYPEDGNTNTLIFTLTPEEFDQIAAGDPVTVRYGREVSYDERDFGPIDKKMLDK